MPKNKVFVVSLSLEAALPPPGARGKSARLSLGIELPRHNQAALELEIATRLLNAIAIQHGFQIENIRSNPNDPPDVYFDFNGTTCGLELTELTLSDRLTKKSIYKRLSRSIISGLAIGELTRDLVVSISMSNDNTEKKFDGRGLDQVVIKLIKDYLATNKNFDVESVINLPEGRGKLVLYKSDLSDDPRLKQRDEPLIVFSGLSGSIYPDTDIPKMINKVLQPKLTIRLPLPLVLLIWTEETILSSFDEHIKQAIEKYGFMKLHGYSNIIYMSLFTSAYHILVPPEKPTKEE